jgi:hypothetical protein
MISSYLTQERKVLPPQPVFRCMCCSELHPKVASSGAPRAPAKALRWCGSPNGFVNMLATPKSLSLPTGPRRRNRATAPAVCGATLDTPPQPTGPDGPPPPPPGFEAGPPPPPSGAAPPPAAGRNASSSTAASKLRLPLICALSQS